VCTTIDRSIKHRRKNAQKRRRMCSKFANDYGHSCRFSSAKRAQVKQNFTFSLFFKNQVLILEKKHIQRYLLKFGKVSKYLGYNALEDFFPSMTLRPNENCADSFCFKRQKEYNAYLEEQEKLLRDQPVKQEEVVEEDLHPDNEFRKIYA
jgi:hypothetical protein